MRPEQWTKNLVVFAALIFSRNLLQVDLALKAVEAFFIFCLLSGTIYVINDIADIEKDKLHDRKKHRPLPSGQLSVGFAGGVIALTAVLALWGAWLVGPSFVLVCIAFLILNLLYSFVLKRIAILDVISISISFILRAFAGVAALNSIDPEIKLSAWLLLCTLFLSLFLAFCKRRHELTTLSESAADHRESLRDYSPALLDQLVGITAGASILSYSIYTIWPDTVAKFGTANLVYTVPLVLIGVMRYLFLVYNEDKGGNPSELFLHERFLLIDVLLWIVLVVVILWYF